MSSEKRKPQFWVGWAGLREMATGVHLSIELLAKCCDSRVRILGFEPGPWEAIDSAEVDLFSFESSLRRPYPQTPRRDALRPRRTSAEISAFMSCLQSIAPRVL